MMELGLRIAIKVVVARSLTRIINRMVFKKETQSGMTTDSQSQNASRQTLASRTQRAYQMDTQSEAARASVYLVG